MIDLRSDTVTIPSQEMLAAMNSAQVGDDVFGEDPTINELQDYAANLFGMDEALFFPSGTMANQTAIKVHTRPGDELICDAEAHVHYYEGGGIASNSGVSVSLIPGARGVFGVQDVLDRIRPDNVHFPASRIVCIENSCNRGGGKVFPISNIKSISEACRSNGLKLHMDGARLFNAMLSEGSTPKDHGALFDSISICLSKGLGAPVGSILLGDTKFISQARRVRKVFGGGMRQAGFIAAGGLFALKHNVGRLAIDHEHAELIASTLNGLPYIEHVYKQETNIVIFQLQEYADSTNFMSFLSEKGIKALTMGPRMLRFVTHLGISREQVETTISILNSYKLNKGN